MPNPIATPALPSVPAPNTDAVTPPPMKIGRWQAKPFTLQTFIVLEGIHSPLVEPFETDEEGNLKKDASGNPIPRPFTMTDTAEALWAFINWHRPDVMMILRDRTRFDDEVAHLAGGISFSDVAEIQRDLNAIFASVNAAMADSGLTGKDGAEKKGGTGFSE